MGFSRAFLPATIFLVGYGAVIQAAPVGGLAAPNPRLLSLEPNRWIKIHEQTAKDAVRFQRQEHGGSCFDTRRGRLVLFGSNTHGRDWENSPLLFDPATLAWSRLYPFDPPQTYSVTAQGIPVAGVHSDHPWAMHTFGAVLYDPVRDEMVVACYPAHMVPGRFSNALKDLWPKVRRFPTWTYDWKTNRWQALKCDPIHFFPYCAAFDTDRNAVLGHRPDGIYELSGEPRRWNRLTDKVFLTGWHTNAAYDARQKALVVFGHNENRNDIEAFWPATGRHRLMPTPGQRPPRDQHNPMAFVPEVGCTVVLVDRVIEGAGEKKSLAETWLYDLAADRWTSLPGATLPQGCGMNYNMQYDPRHQCLLLVTGDHRQATTVWALRVQSRQQPANSR